MKQGRYTLGDLGLVPSKRSIINEDGKLGEEEIGEGDTNEVEKYDEEQYSDKLELEKTIKEENKLEPEKDIEKTRKIPSCVITMSDPESSELPSPQETPSELSFNDLQD